MVKKFPGVEAFVRRPPVFNSSGELVTGRRERLKAVRDTYTQLALKRAEVLETDLANLDALAAECLYERLKRMNIPDEVAEFAAAESELDPWLCLQKDEQLFANRVIFAMAERWGLDETDFSLVKTSDELGNDTFSVVYSADNGIDLANSRGDYDRRRNWSKTLLYYSGSTFHSEAEIRYDSIELNGQTIDTQTGSTDAVLYALARLNPNIKDERVWRINSPDLKRPSTLMHNPNMAPMAYINQGTIAFYLEDEVRDSEGIRIRPAVVVAVHQKSDSA